MRIIFFASLAFAFPCGGGTHNESEAETYDESTGGEANSSDVTIVNDSNYTIYYLYVSPTSDNMWGEDQLGSEVISANGGSFTLTNIPCDSYDVRLVDEDEDECVVEGVDICVDSGWHITNEDLLSCEGYN